MIYNIIQLLKLQDYYGVSKNIDIAKGVNEYPKTIKNAFKQAKREFKNIGNGRKKDN